MEQFWQQNRLTLSVEIFGILIAAFIVAALAISIGRSMQGPASRLKIMLEHPRAILTFKVFRIVLGLIGIATLVVTFLPGLMPFKDRVDPNLELGGIVLFLLWPLIVVQVIVGFLPVEKKLEPPLAWGLLIICFTIGLSVCKMAVSLLYN